MRLVAAALGILLVSPLSGTEIERALTLARARDTERQQFHRRYISDLTGPSVTQIEVITEFRRLVITAEEHVMRGDWMFTRGLRAAEDAMKPTRGVITIRAQVRFNPLNTFIESPPYTLALAKSDKGPFEPLSTQLSPQYSNPVRGKDKKTISSLIGCSLEGNVPSSRIGAMPQVVGVTLNGADTGHSTFDFARLD